MVEYLIAQNPNHFKGLLRCHRVDEHVAMDTNEVLGVQDAVFILKHRPAWGLSVSQVRAGRSLYCTKPRWGGGGRFNNKYLPSRVDYFGRKFLAPVFNHTTEGILDGRVITLHEMALDELYRE